MPQNTRTQMVQNVEAQKGIRFNTEIGNFKYFILPGVLGRNIFNSYIIMMDA